MDYSKILRRNSIIQCLFTVLVFLHTLKLEASEIKILVNPGPFASIEQAVHSEEKVNWWDAELSDDRACTECFAAMELAHFLSACTELQVDEISIGFQNHLSAKDRIFLVGSSRSNPLIASQKISERHKLNTRESFLIKTIPNSNRIITIIEGKDRVGALYGVYAYLEQLGIRFYGLGQKGTVYPDKPVELPRNLNIVENPSYLTRGFWAWEDRGNQDFFLWMARNRMNFWTAAEKEVNLLKKFGMKLTAGGHVIQKYFLDPQAEYPYNHPVFKSDEDKPKDPYPVNSEYKGDTNRDGKLTYFEAHPEWYGLRAGKRSDNIRGDFGDNYCTSNTDATKELAKNLVQSLIDGPWRHVDIVSFWMLDGGKWCQCESCKKQGTYTDRLFEVVHEVMTEINRAQRQGRLKRNVEMSTLAYLETLSPPTKPIPQGFDYNNCSVTFFPILRCYVHSLADPKCTEINNRILRNYQGWTTAANRFYQGSIFIGEYYNISGLKSLPVLYKQIIEADIPWYYRTGARHFHYMHTPTRLWGTWTLNQYLLARLLWDTQANVDNLLEEYFDSYYPTTNKYTRDFYDLLEFAMANTKTLKYSLRGILAKDNVQLFSLDHLHYDSFRPSNNDGPDMVEIVDTLKQARSKLDAALIQCTDNTEQLRLLEDENRFGYGEAMIYFYYHLTRTAVFHRRGDEIMARHEFDKVEQFAKRLKAITDLVHVASSHANAKDGLEATQAVSAYEFYRKKYYK